MSWSIFDLLRRRCAPARRTAATLRKNSARHSRLQLEALEDRLVPSTSSIVSSFNATAIAPGSTIWFNSALSPTLAGTNSVTINVSNQTVTFSDTLNGVTTPYTVNVPNAQITFSSAYSSATTTFNSTTNTWVTTAPLGLAGNEFMSGASLGLSSGLHGGDSVTWAATISSDTPGVSLTWEWSAAVYSRFNASYSALGVKPCDSSTASSYANADHAGSPESYKSFVTSGARGTGGTNYTGTYSTTATLSPSSNNGFISGMVYNDLNSSGQLKSSDPMLSGWTVQLYTQTNGTLSASPIATTTSDALGCYSFSNLGALPSGTSYVVAEVVNTSWQQTSPTSSTTGTTALPNGQRAYVYPVSDGSDLLNTGSTNTSVSGTGTLNYVSNIAGVSGSVSANDGMGDTISSASTVFDQMNATFTPTGGLPVSFNTFCIDLFHDVSIGQSLSVYVSGNESTAYANGSRMAYIYDLYGAQNLSSSPYQAAAVQLALWDLSLNNHNPTSFAKDADGTYSSGDESVYSVSFNSSTDAANVAPLVNQYLQASIGATIQGGWFNAAANGTSTSRGQNMPFPSPLENFGNHQPPPTTISGTVYEDKAATGTLVAGDPGIAGVTLTLTGTNTLGQSVTAITTTAANGTYTFSTDIYGNQLIAGTYQITETVPAGYLLDATNVGNLTNTPVNWNLGFQQAITGNGPGFAPDAIKSSTDNIFTGGGSKDTSGVSQWQWTNAQPQGKDDLEDAFGAVYADAGSGHTLMLIAADRYSNSGDSVLGLWAFQNSVTANSGGTFTGVHANGDVLLTIDFATGVISAYRWTGTDASGTLTAITPPSGSLFVSVPTGPVSIPWSFVDANGNTSPQTSEFMEVGLDLSAVFGTSIPHFTSLLTETRSSGSTTSTLSDFVTGGYNTVVGVGPADGSVVSPTVIGSITLPGGETGTGYNFGNIKPITLSGTVYQDNNGNGALDVADSGLAGVTLTLTGSNDKGQSITATTTTAANGTYAFSTDGGGNLLRPGTYQIVETQPSGYLAGATAVGTVNGTTDGTLVSSTTISSIALSESQSGAGYNFGNYKPVSVTGTVYQDTNGNGVFDAGDTGIAGVTVTLAGTNGLGQAVTATVVSGAGGSYGFSGDASGNPLRPGTYTITETAPSGYLLGAANLGTVNGAADGTVSSATQLSAIGFTSGQTGSNYNFGNYKPVALSGTVYRDANDNGMFDAGEAAISGVTLTLTGTSGLGQPITATAISAANGTYGFTTDSSGNALRPGSYTITETAPSGYIAGVTTVGTVNSVADGTSPAFGTVSAIALASGQAGAGYNFGHLKAVSVSGLVYQDTNGNGALDAGEPGIAGVTMTLTGTNLKGQSITATTTTGANGTFSFTSDSNGNALRPGTYAITETQPSGYLWGNTVVGTVNSAADGVVVTAGQVGSIALADGQSGVNYNFGNVKAVSLGGMVYQDSNGNNALDAGEPGIQGVTVTLTGTNGLGQAVTATTTTAANGVYSFTTDSNGNALRPGNYVITETAPSGYLLGAATLGTVNGAADGTVTSATKFSSIALTSGQGGVNYNFGDLKAVTLSGMVYQDSNGNNALDAGEPGIAGVTVTLTGTNGLGQPVTAMTTTGAGGAYSFSTDSSGNALRPGSYGITETAPSGYLVGAATLGTVNGAADGIVTSMTKFSSIALTSGQVGVNYNFGDLKAVTLSGTVYHDANDNGAFDSGESGISGVTLTLIGTNSLGQAVTATTTTGAGGVYSFSTDSSGNALRPGTYQIVETHPSGYVAGATTLGTVSSAADGTVVSSGTIGSIVLTSGQAAVNYNFGEVKAVGVSGLVYEDTNGNGALNSGEPGLAGVTVTLTGTNDKGQSITATTTTATGGTFSFTTDGSGNLLRPGTYAVTEALPGGYLWGTTAVGTVNGSADGSVVTAGQIGSIVLADSQSGVNYNFGNVRPVGLSGTVYQDTNGNGALDVGETGMQGVTLTLTGTNGLGQSVTATTTTDASGNYSFSTDGSGNALRPGTYQITEMLPSGYLAGTNAVGTVNGSADGTLVGSTAIGSIHLLSGQSGSSYNFGELQPVTVSGTAYLDSNEDGVYDAGDSPFAIVALTLTGTNGKGQAVTATTITAADGTYSFTKDNSGNVLLPGTYQIKETVPVNYVAVAANIGTVGGLTDGAKSSPTLISSIAMTSGQSGIHYNFGLSVPASVSGYVYLDDAGTQTYVQGDRIEPGATLQLTGTDAWGNAVSVTVTTDVNGYYIFSGLSTGTYTVTLLDGTPTFQAEVANVGSVNNTLNGVASSLTEIGQVQLIAGNIGVNYDFGGIYYGGIGS